MNEVQTVRLAGVTFENRQEILRNLYLKNGTTNKLKLEDTEFEGEPAIKVYEEKDNIQIGWIPKAEVQKFYKSNIEIVNGIIDYYKDTWYCKILVK